MFLDYAQALTRLPQLRERLVQGDGALDADETSELDHFSRSVPKLVSILPDVLPDRSNSRHTAAAAEMTTRLVRHLDQIRPVALVSAHFPFEYVSRVWTAADIDAGCSHRRKLRSGRPSSAKRHGCGTSTQPCTSGSSGRLRWHDHRPAYVCIYRNAHPAWARARI